MNKGLRRFKERMKIVRGYGICARCRISYTPPKRRSGSEANKLKRQFCPDCYNILYPQTEKGGIKF